ncbi:MAG: hypothetical protein ACXVHT_12805 [Methanobacterium sp.]
MGSLALNTDEIQNLKEIIASEGLKEVPTKSEYELLRIKDNGISIVLYKSGKAVFNDGAMQIMDSILTEESFDYVLGSDEAGKGEWFGPLVVVATALTPGEIMELRKSGVRDSKTLKKDQIIKLGKKLLNMEFVKSSRILVPKTYNRLYHEFKTERKNLNDLMAWAHSAVIKETLAQIEFKKAKLVIDKFDVSKTEFRLLNLDKTNLEIIQKSRAESEVPVAAASIIAKYLFEREVDKLNSKYEVDLRQMNPAEVDSDILPYVSKMHFKNVKNKC